MAKRMILSIAATALIFVGTAALDPTPAQATFWQTDRTSSQGTGGWMARWQQKWQEKMARKRLLWDRHFGAKQTAAPASPPPRRYQPMK